MGTLETKIAFLNQELKIKLERLKYHKKLHERKIINRLFDNNPIRGILIDKKKNIEAETTLAKEETGHFWKNI